MESELAKSHSSVFTSRQLPKRVSVTLPSSELTLCEYCFPDESEEVWSFSLPVYQSSSYKCVCLECAQLYHNGDVCCRIAEEEWLNCLVSVLRT